MQTDLTDETSLSHLPSVAHYIRKIFLVSDNDAYNRLYEFLGQAYFNQKLHAKGLTDTRIIHRLSVSGFDTLANQTTNPVAFANDHGICYQQGEVHSRFYDDLGLSDQQKGTAYIDANDQRVEQPFDFRHKNYVSLQDLHDMLRAVIFPQSVGPSQDRHRIPCPLQSLGTPCRQLLDGRHQNVADGLVLAKLAVEPVILVVS
jgi:hypothetical protein